MAFAELVCFLRDKSWFVCVFVGEGLCTLPKHLEYKREGTETLPYELSLSLAPTNPDFFTAPTFIETPFFGTMWASSPTRLNFNLFAVFSVIHVPALKGFVPSVV